jgi:hypothetical protein
MEIPANTEGAVPQRSSLCELFSTKKRSPSQVAAELDALSQGCAEPSGHGTRDTMLGVAYSMRQ